MKSSISELQSKLADWSDENFYMGFSHEDSDGHPTHCGIFFDSNHWTKYADIELIKQYIDPKKIKELTIGCEKDNETNYIPKEFISEFSNIEFLRLSRLKFNYENHIAADIFEHLTQLKTVEIFMTALEPIPPNLFQNCTKIEKLEFENIQSHQIPLGFFHSLRELKIIKLSGYGPKQYYGTDITPAFERFHPDLLINNTKLEYFGLGTNDSSLPEIHDNLFRNCTVLKEIHLYNHSDEVSCLGKINLENNKNLKSVTIYGKLCEETRNHLLWMKENRPDVKIDIDYNEN